MVDKECSSNGAPLFLNLNYMREITNKFGKFSNYDIEEQEDLNILHEWLEQVKKSRTLIRIGLKRLEYSLEDVNEEERPALRLKQLKSSEAFELQGLLHSMLLDRIREVKEKVAKSATVETWV